MRPPLLRFGSALVLLLVCAGCASEKSDPLYGSRSGCGSPNSSASCKYDDPDDTTFDSNEGCDSPNSSASCDSPPRTCAEVQQEAKEQLAGYQFCRSDEDCSLVSVAASCLDAFACPVAVNRTSNLGALGQHAYQLSQAYSRCHAASGSCPTPVCEAQRAVSCDLTTNLCTLSASSSDAGILPLDGGAEAADAGGDAGTGDAAMALGGLGMDATVDTEPDAATVDPRFACAQASDCAVKNVGNCCGYYPRCANVGATFSPPDCSDGQGSVCGWPEITSCDCRANTCVSLQNGSEI